VTSAFRGGLGFLVVVAAAIPNSASSQETSQTLSGRVVRGTDSASVASLTVELHQVTRDGGGLVDSVTAGPDGGFTFALTRSDEATDASVVWIAAARHEGILYFGGPVHAGLDMAEDYRIVVYDTAMVAGPVTDLVTELRHVVLSAIPDHSGLIQVSEIIDVTNEGAAAIVGADPSTLVWRLPLPPGASSTAVMEGGLPTDAVVFEQGSVGIVGNLPPPGVRLAIQYMVAADRFDLEIAHETRRLDVLADQGGGPVEVEGLSRGEVQDIPGSVILRFTGTDLAPGTTVTIRTPAPAVPSRTAAWIWLVAAGTLLVAAGVAMTRLRPTEAPR
jgi:hypothetical protein